MDFKEERESEIKRKTNELIEKGHKVHELKEEIIEKEQEFEEKVIKIGKKIGNSIIKTIIFPFVVILLLFFILLSLYEAGQSWMLYWFSEDNKNNLYRNACAYSL